MIDPAQSQLPAIFTDRRGPERIMIHNDGSMLTTVIRGVDCYGSDFHSLAPEVESDRFDLHGGSLCGYLLIVAIPIRLITPESLRMLDIRVKVDLGFPGPTGGVDRETLKIQLVQPEFSAISSGQTECFEPELRHIARQLPRGFALQTCATCGLSDYNLGPRSFGGLACFREVAEDYHRVDSKADIFKIWPRLTEYVQETHFCPRLEPRPPGKGYRG